MKSREQELGKIWKAVQKGEITRFEAIEKGYEQGISEEKARWKKKIIDWANTYKLDKKLEWMLEVLIGDAE